MGIKTVSQPLYSPDFVPCDFWLFPKLTGCRYETIEEMKETVTKVIDTLTQEDLHGAFQKLLERYNECIAVLERGLEFDVCTINKSAHTKKSRNLFNDPRIYNAAVSYIYKEAVMYILDITCIFKLGYPRATIA